MDAPTLVRPEVKKERRGLYDPWLVSVLVLSSALFGLQMSWGLPNGDDSWAADAMGPVTTLGIVYRSFSEWNSGWYYFKYPLGYPFLLFLSSIPYLGWLRLTGSWASPSPVYPYGFEDAEQAIFVMAMIGRLLNVVFGLGVVAVTYGIARRLLGLWTARLAAVFVATAYPIIYYTHARNLDISYLFWLLLALYSAILASTSKRARVWGVLGLAAAMAVSSKEQGFAFLLPLPFMALFTAVRRDGWAALYGKCALAMAAGAIGTAILANNAIFNPLGVVSRVAFLLGRPLQPVTVRLAPVEFALWKGAKEWIYVEQTWDGVQSTLGTPLVLLALVGMIVLATRRRALLWLTVPALSHYYLSLRGLDLITLRYLLPVSIIAAILAAFALQWVHHRTVGICAGRPAALVAVLVCLLSLARGIETHWLFATDSRYRAESWIRDNLPPGASVEYYQKPTYLPRFRGAVDGKAIEMDQRTIAGLAQRQPTAIVLSSASAKSIAHVWNPDWRETNNLLKPIPEAAELVDKLGRGELGYRPVAVFRQTPKLLRLRITSLAPEITIYARK